MHRRETGETRRSDLEETWLEGGLRIASFQRLRIRVNAICHHEFLDGFLEDIFARRAPRNSSRHSSSRVSRPENSKHRYKKLCIRIGKDGSIRVDGSKERRKNHGKSLHDRRKGWEWNLWYIFLDISKEKSIFICNVCIIILKVNINGIFLFLYRCIFDISRTFMRTICIFHMFHTLYINIINIIRRSYKKKRAPA